MYYVLKKQHSISIQHELVNLAKEQLEKSIETFDAVTIEKIDNLMLKDF